MPSLLSSMECTVSTTGPSHSWRSYSVPAATPLGIYPPLVGAGRQNDSPACWCHGMGGMGGWSAALDFVLFSLRAIIFTWLVDELVDRMYWALGAASIVALDCRPLPNEQLFWLVGGMECAVGATWG